MSLPETTVPDRKAFEAILDDALKKAELKLPAPAKRAVLECPLRARCDRRRLPRSRR